MPKRTYRSSLLSLNFALALLFLSDLHQFGPTKIIAARALCARGTSGQQARLQRRTLEVAASESASDLPVRARTRTLVRLSFVAAGLTTSSSSS